MDQLPERSDVRLSVALWKQNNPAAIEMATIDRVPNGFRLSGDVVVADNDAPHSISYHIDVNNTWETESASVSLTPNSGPERTIELRSSPNSSWSRRVSTDSWIDLPDFDGLIDIDLGCTPATNLLPIRRFDLDIGESHETTAVWVAFPSLEIRRLPQRYTRISEFEFLYESFASGFSATLHVDAFGVVNRYSDIWIRLNAEPEPAP